MKRLITNKQFDLRDWQIEAFSKVKEYISAGEKDFLAVATPGAGKTKYALIVAHELLKEKIIDRLVVVTPTESLKKQWALEASIFADIDLDPNFSNNMLSEADDYHGMAITYALLGMDKYQIHSQLTFNKRTGVIFDEVHHAGDNLSWGDAVKSSFSNAIFRLSLSGTPFRSDANEIPFIRYENNMSKADYNYSYTRAIEENVCRPVYFSIFDGKMKWKVGTEEFEHDFNDYLDQDQVSKRLRTALDSNGQWVKDVLKAAHKKLIQIRKTHPKAAGMVFATTQQDALKLARVLLSITGILPPVIISDEGKGSQRIEEFRNSDEMWLVSVRMVSEGVDIPRLRVGVYLTNIKAELFFRQAVGRFVRVQKELKNQEAYIFIPQDKDIVKLAETIQEEREHALDELDKNKGESDVDLFGNEYRPALQGKFVPIGSSVTNEKTLATTVGITSGMKTSIHIPVTEQSPVFKKKEELKRTLNILAKKVALKSTNGNSSIQPDWKFAHKKYTEAGGKNMSQETVDELLKRKTFYENMLRVV